MEGKKADLGAVAEQQKHEGEVEQRRVEARGMGHEIGPHHGIEAAANRGLGRHIDENGAEQSERDADAAENEIFPGGFERLVRPVDADHQHGGQRGQLDRRPTSRRYCW